MKKETPWYLRPPTEEELRHYAVHPYDGVPEHLRPQFLESEWELKGRLQRESLGNWDSPNYIYER